MMQCKRVLEEFQSKFLDVKNMVITCPVDLVRRHLVGQGCEGILLCVIFSDFAHIA
jgi:hypothetical protein